MKTLVQSLVIIFTFFPFLQYGQMVLVTKDKSVIKVDSVQQYDGYIKYILKNSQTVYFIPNEDIILLESYRGKINDRVRAVIFEGQRSLALKLSLTAFGGESIVTSLEKNISQRISIEASLKLHSSSFGDYYYEDVNGWGIELSGRWKLLNPYSINKKLKFHHRMSGPYLKPGIGLSTREEFTYQGVRNYDIYYASISMGYQVIISNTFAIDFFAGGAIYYGNGNSTPLHEMFSVPIKVELNEGDLVGKNNLARTIGFRIGILLGS